MSVIEKFIKRFHSYDNIDDVFTNGCCYWFARILLERFTYLNPVLMYDQIDNHFGVKIDNSIYDITGDVTDRYNWIQWENVDDDLLRKRISRDCILF